MRIKLEGFNPKSLVEKGELSSQLNSFVTNVNKSLMDTFYGNLDTKDGRLRLREATPKSVVEEVKGLVAEILGMMGATQDQINTTETQIGESFKMPIRV